MITHFEPGGSQFPAPSTPTAEPVYPRARRPFETVVCPVFIAVVAAVTPLPAVADMPVRPPVSRAATATTAPVFALEQFAVPPLSWKGVQPDRTTRASLLPAHYVDPFTFSLQALAVAVPPVSWQGVYPESARRASLHVSEHPSLFKAEAVEQFAVPPLSWQGWQPPTTRRAALTTATMLDPVAFALQAVAVVVPPVSWLGTYPDTTRRATLTTAQYPWLFKGEAIEQFSVPALSWKGEQPARVWSLRLQPAHMQAPITFADRDVAVNVPPLAWGPQCPDTTRRATLPIANLSFVFRAESLEQFAATLQWASIGPDRTWRLALSTAQHPASARVDVVILAPALSWQPSYPPTTRRASLTSAQHPSFVHSEAIEQFAPKLLWNAFYPDTTRRAVTLSDAVRSTIGWSNWVNPQSASADFIVQMRADISTIAVKADASVVSVAADATTTATRSDDVTIVIRSDTGTFKA